MEDWIKRIKQIQWREWNAWGKLREWKVLIKGHFPRSALFWGVVFSLLYLLTIVWVLRWERVMLFFTLADLNNIGDFLAGVFGPLSIAWVVLGYWQSQRALREQSDELRNAVESARAHLEIERRKVEPDLYFQEVYFIKVPISSKKPKLIRGGKDQKLEIEIIFYVNNTGAKVDLFEIFMWRRDPEVCSFYQEVEKEINPNSYEKCEFKIDLSEGESSDFIRDLYDHPDSEFSVYISWASGGASKRVVYYKAAPSSSEREIHEAGRSFKMYHGELKLDNSRTLPA